MLLKDGIEILYKYKNRNILNKSMINDISKSMDSHFDYKAIMTCGELLLTETCHQCDYTFCSIREACIRHNIKSKEDQL